MLIYLQRRNCHFDISVKPQHFCRCLTHNTCRSRSWNSIILSGDPGWIPSSWSLIFCVSGDICQDRLNCYANTESEIRPILVPLTFTFITIQLSSLRNWLTGDMLKPIRPGEVYLFQYLYFPRNVRILLHSVARERGESTGVLTM